MSKGKLQKKHRFAIRLSCIARIEIDDSVVVVVDDEWRSQFYNLHSIRDIAKHIGYNMIVNLASLSQLDGWADQPDENAIFVASPDWEVDEIEFEFT